MAVIEINPSVLNQPGDHIDALNLSPLSQAAREFEDVQGLATGVSIPSKFELIGTKQTVKMQMQQPDPHSVPSQTTPGRNVGAVGFSLEAEEGIKSEKNLRRPQIKPNKKAESCCRAMDLDPRDNTHALGLM